MGIIRQIIFIVGFIPFQYLEGIDIDTLPNDSLFNFLAVLKLNRFIINFKSRHTILLC